MVTLEKSIPGPLRQEGIALTSGRTIFEAAVREAIAYH
jgi:hypothetical protein